VTGSDVVLDAWGWWEVLRDSARGAQIRERFIGTDSVRLHTSAITVGEIAVKLASMGEGGRIDSVLGAIRRAGPLVDVTAERARAAGLLEAQLRTADSHASLADGTVLATARSLRARLISADPAFRGRADVLADFSQGTDRRATTLIRRKTRRTSRIPTWQSHLGYLRPEESADH
jgi:predicted nucleic acid-binding protein